MKVGDLVHIVGEDELGIILSSPRKRYMIGYAARVFVKGKIRYILEEFLALAIKENANES
tara:strand:+ start:777 stop:956 length:180 start_codon:yes stop_codon:yes gene_type:complete